ncbi:quinone oxidoreductase [Martensiomyces pterosporus]|nr:quinone oxidoreductase [Martensiomyces pterosporus]
MPSMKAVLLKQPGGIEQLYVGETEKPVPSPSEILVKISYFALNRMDSLQRKGVYPVPPQASPILGVEMAGVVVETGSEAKRFKVGDKVFGLMYGGAYAQYATIDESSALPLGSLSLDLASSLLECWYTAYQAVQYIGQLKPGEDILVHAAAGGVGTAAIQLAKMYGARRIFVTASSPAKLEYCKKLGATHLINYREQSFKDVVLRETDGRGVDVICDFLLASYFSDNLDSLARDGRLSLQATMGGTVVEKLNLAPILFKRLRVEGTTLRSRSLPYQRELRRAFEAEVLPHIESGEVEWHIAKVFDWEDIQGAHRLLEDASFTGKIVVRVTDNDD